MLNNVLEFILSFMHKFGKGGVS